LACRRVLPQGAALIDEVRLGVRDDDLQLIPPTTSSITNGVRVKP
jgi:hypothetical protein